MLSIYIYMYTSIRQCTVVWLSFFVRNGLQQIAQRNILQIRQHMGTLLQGALFILFPIAVLISYKFHHKASPSCVLPPSLPAWKSLRFLLAPEDIVKVQHILHTFTLMGIQITVIIGRARQGHEYLAHT